MEVNAVLGTPASVATAARKTEDMRTPRSIEEARKLVDSKPIKDWPWGIYVDEQIVSIGERKAGNEREAKWWRTHFPGRVTTRRRREDDQVWGEPRTEIEAIEQLDAELAALQAADLEAVQR